MSVSFKYILLVLLSTINVGEATGDVTKQQSGTATAKTFTDVVSLDFCESHLHAEDKMGKKTFQEVYAYAELKNAPQASLPESFTVCSTAMATDCKYPQLATFFNILNSSWVHSLSRDF